MFRAKTEIIEELKSLGVEITPEIESMKGFELEALVKEKKADDDDVDAPRITPPEEKKEDVPQSSGRGAAAEDYLQNYQVKKLNGNPYQGGKQTDPDPGSKAEIMKAQLLKQKRVLVMIPVEAGASPKVPLSVTLNGYRLDLPKNTYVEVPEQVAEVIRNSLQQQVEALNQMRTDRNKDTQSALS